ncbi:MAG: hypothetical protein ACOX6P_09295 [Candidatus Merdivicinus sp.]
MDQAKKWKLAGIITAVLAVISAVLVWGPWIYLFWEMKVMPAFTSSLGIIGGADGPTSVYVATAVVLTGNIWGDIFYWAEMLLPLILAAVSIICFVWRRKLLKKGE